jgi:hypothetical protein
VVEVVEQEVELRMQELEEWVVMEDQESLA